MCSQTSQTLQNTNQIRPEQVTPRTTPNMDNFDWLDTQTTVTTTTTYSPKVVHVAPPQQFPAYPPQIPPQQFPAYPPQYPPTHAYPSLNPVPQNAMALRPNPSAPAPMPIQIRQQIVQVDTLVEALIASLRGIDQTATQICQNIEKNPRFYVKRKQQMGTDVLTDKLSDMKMALRKDVSMPLQTLMERDGNVPGTVMQEITRAASQAKEMLSYLEHKAMVTTLGVKRKSSYYGSNRVESLCADIREVLANFDVQFPQIRVSVTGGVEINRDSSQVVNQHISQTTNVKRASSGQLVGPGHRI